jgi:20S proteasome alpha/beta subunit
LTKKLNFFQAVAGYYPDSRQLVKKARSECVQYQQFYGSKIPGHLLCDRLSSHVHLYTLYWHLRPFGSSVLLGSYDYNGPALYMIEPSGTSWVSSSSSLTSSLGLPCLCCWKRKTKFKSRIRKTQTTRNDMC